MSRDPVDRGAVDEAVRSAALWCPDWPVVAHRRDPAEPVAVVHANRVVAVSVAARAAGVVRGLRRREAQSRCPALEVIERDRALEVRAFERVVGALDELTPRVEVVRPGLVVFPTRGPARYFGGDAPMAQRALALAAGVLAPADGGPSDVRMGVADGAFGAVVAARRADPGGVVVIEAGTTAAFLSPLPIRLLERPELTDVLIRLGLTTLGAFAALDRADVIGRFGADGGVAHRLASGLDARPPVLTTPPPEMEVVAELDPPVERVDQAAFVGKALADELLARLGARGATCTRVVISAETEHGEELVRCWRHDGPLRAAVVADRVRWQLDGWLDADNTRRPTGGLTRLAVRPDDLFAAVGRQLGFWGAPPDSVERVGRAVARVQGLLGADAVRVPERRAGRSPDEKIVAVAADTVDLARADIARGEAVEAAPGGRRGGSGRRKRARAGPVPDPWPGSLPGPMPARVHRPAVPAELLDAAGEPVGVDARALVSAPPCHLVVDTGRPVAVVSWAGPWLIDERWWDAGRRRRRARFQVVDDRGVARLVVLEGGRWWIEATYD